MTALVSVSLVRAGPATRRAATTVGVTVHSTSGTTVVMTATPGIIPVPAAVSVSAAIALSPPRVMSLRVTRLAVTVAIARTVTVAGTAALIAVGIAAASLRVARSLRPLPP